MSFRYVFPQFVICILTLFMVTFDAQIFYFVTVTLSVDSFDMCEYLKLGILAKEVIFFFPPCQNRKQEAVSITVSFKVYFR